MKDTVFFDLGGTLVSYYTRAEFPAVLGRCISAVRDFLRGRGFLRLDPEAISERVAYEDHEDPSLRVRRLEERLIRIFDIDEIIQPPDLVGEMCRRFMGPVFALARVYDDALPVLGDLRAEGFRTALVSNSPWGSPADLWREELRRLGLDGLFDAAVFCGDVGWRKPAGEVFDFTMRALRVRPEQCVFVGDDPRWDVQGPRAVGIEAILLDRGDSAHAPGENVIRGLRGIWTKLRLRETAAGDESPQE